MDIFITMRKDPETVQQGLVKDLAKEFSCSLSTVEQILESEQQQLEQGARIKDFIPVLAIKQVKERLRMSRYTFSRDEQHNLTHPLPSH